MTFLTKNILKTGIAIFWKQDLYRPSLLYTITIKSFQDRSQKSLGYFLQCNGESESSAWSCNARAELRMYNHKEGHLYKHLKILENNFLTILIYFNSNKNLCEENIFLNR